MNLEEFMAESVAGGASDIYLSTGVPPSARIDGNVVISNYPIIRAETLRSFLSAVIPSDRMEVFESTKECDFSLDLMKIGRFRVNVLWQERGLALVFRVISRNIPSLDELDAPEVFRKIINRSSGLVLVVGATGSGKSTTLAAITSFLNDEFSYNIITVEDPIEFIHAPRRSIINQRELHRHTHSFANALRAALREDPDCILVGELRDLETIRLALTAAETGHLVLATLHTNSAARTLDRIVDVFPAEEKILVRTMLAESLNAVICQRLVRKIGGGRAAAWEVMISTPAIRNLIREGKTAQIYSTIQTSQEQGMMTMEASLRDLVRRRLITEAECQGVLG
ncbi:type IV pilus twitching motility protein PilT [Burkholderia sp. 9775_39]|uniref:type IV pilus twitching motility protein PilT n=1 Tax=unclassified Burkholderia TaxID=2613784 RepID=UPI0018C439D1|nr:MULTISPECIES: type IV pilus twitching motility protein PilT [unclassified Burkholderia]MBG0881258.1 type IV pilus twitching motility protein PilT [Burkholderia sp. 9775_39]MBG0887665.1 type IV pilus twitching motility protein PilT [Burkholderia sp. 9773_38]